MYALSGKIVLMKLYLFVCQHSGTIELLSEKKKPDEITISDYV
jgi:hypothetical protein